MKLTKIAQCIALMGVAGVAALPQAQAQSLQRVEITGSNIKRVQSEGALPVQTIGSAEIAKMGISNAEQLLSVISVNGNGIDNMMTNQGGDFLASTGFSGKTTNQGSSSANLRGMGSDKTLVLLNGRRISSNGLTGASADLNSLPVTAIDRVEILKDGASAIYGTDAIGGVINFILKKNYQGFEVSAMRDQTQQGGGNINTGSLTFGAGDIEKDKFNILGSLTLYGNDRLRGDQRKSFHNGYQPDRGLAPDTTGTPFATISQRSGTAFGSTFAQPDGRDNANRVNLLAVQGKCQTGLNMVPYRDDITGFTNNHLACAYDYGASWSLMQPAERTNLVTKATFQLTPNHTVFAEVLASKNKSTSEWTENQATDARVGTATTARNGGVYPAYLPGTTTRAPYYLDMTGIIPGFDNTKNIQLRWRCIPCGPRQLETQTDAYRLLLGSEGMLGSWDYKTAVSTASTKGYSVYGDGHTVSSKFEAAMRTGLINPFSLTGAQTPEAMALIESTKAKGLSLFGGQSTSHSFDANISKEIATLPAGPLLMSVGVDVRKDIYKFNDNSAGNPVINGTASPSAFDEVNRTITAVYSELNVPVSKTVESQLALRHDRYSDVGSTTNPKAAIRWQPAKEFLVRGSVGTGFKAPDFGAMYAGDNDTLAFNSDVKDPLLCPTDSYYCAFRPGVTLRSNPNLKPEKSEQFSVGFVLSPNEWFTGSIDIWRTKISDRISARNPRLILDNQDKFPGKYDSVDEVVIMDYINVAQDTATGADISLSAVFKNDSGRFNFNLDGTYYGSYKTQLYPGAPESERVGEFGDFDYLWDLHVRWKHNASITWTKGVWSSTFSQNYTAGYTSERNGFGTGVGTPAGYPLTVEPYSLYNVSVTYTGIKNLTLTGGIKNLFDTAPPFSAHNVDNVAGAGWDGRVGDPRMRSFTVRANYKFW